METATLEALEQLATAKLERTARHRFITRDQIAAVVRDLLARSQSSRDEGERRFSFSRAIRGMIGMRGEVVNTQTLEGDVEYAKALSSGTSPGSFLAPKIQANAIISQLAQFAVGRASGGTIWNVSGGLEFNVPSGITAPTVLWQAQNSRQTPDSATDFGQVAFSLKQMAALLLIPLQLLRTSKPNFDVIFTDSFALACAEVEDSAMFATSTQSGAPTALLSASGITTLNTSGSANGGNLGLSDVLGMLLKASQLKMKPPFAWYCTPRTLYTRLLGLQDNISRAISIPDLADPVTSGYSLMGYPVYVTTSISETETLGSGSNQSHLILATPRSIHVAQDQAVQLEVALDGQYFDSAQAGLRVGHQVDLSYAPAASIIVLLGVN